MKKMFENYPLIRNITLFILPYICLYALYIQVNGENSPGGGFQAGVIFASAIIGLDLVQTSAKLNKYFSVDGLICIASLGVLIYFLVGATSLLYDDNYLNYYSLAQDKLLAQHIGIFIIEIGIGLTVSAIMCLIYRVITYHEV